MVKSITSIAFALLTGLLSFRVAASDQAVVVRAHFDDIQAARLIASTFGHARIDEKKGVMQLETDANGIKRLRNAGLTVEVDNLATAAVRRALAALAENRKSIDGFSCYRTVEETFQTLDALALQHPTLLSVSDSGQSWLAENGSGGYPLRVARITNSEVGGEKPKLMLVTSIHAREYTPAEIGTRFVEYLLSQYGVNADVTWIVDHHEIHALLQANPDGRKRAEAGASWRKNVNGTACPGGRTGVDLNRNFPWEWGAHDGSSPSPCDDTYRGAAPSSEPETWAVVDYVRSQFSDQRGPGANDAAPSTTSGIFIDIHSFSQLVLWPWGYTEQQAPNGPALATLGRRLAWFNDYTPEQSVGLYATDGTTDDFTYGELGIASYTLELGNSFFESCASFESQVLPETLDALMYAAKVVRVPYVLPAGPETLQITLSSDLLLPGEPVSVQAFVDDTHFNQQLTSHSGPAASVQAIASADAYVDTPPWQAGASPVSMSAVDGAFDSSREAASVSLPGDLSAGRHLVYVRGHDTSGAEGPVSAAFVEVLQPDQVATVHGTIRDAVTNAPLAATVSAGAYSSASDVVDGSYVRRLPVGTYDLRVESSDYEAGTIVGFVAAGGASSELDFSLYPLCSLIDDPAQSVEASPLTAQAPWRLRADSGQPDGPAWVAASGTQYANDTNASLTSATLDLSNYTSPVLQFDSRCDTESGWDFGIVETSSDGGANWSEVFRCDGDPQWSEISVSLPQLEDAASARLRFRFTSDSSVTATGWAVDNIVLKAGGAECRASQETGLAIDAFSAQPSTIVAGSSTELGWRTRNADSCSISNDIDSAQLDLLDEELDEGARTLSPSASVVYTLTCSGDDGPEQMQVAVTVQDPTATAAIFQSGFEASDATRRR